MKQSSVLSSEEKRYRLAQSECPVEEWWEYAIDYPWEAMHSPLYPLLALLERPDRWDALCRTPDPIYHWVTRATWVETYCRHLPRTVQRAFLLDCVEHIWPTWTIAYPEDQTLLRVKELLQAHLAGTLSDEESLGVGGSLAIECTLRADNDRCAAILTGGLGQQSREQSRTILAFANAMDVASALSCAFQTSIETGAFYAARAQGTSCGEQNVFTEQDWQWQRMLSYLEQYMRIL